MSAQVPLLMLQGVSYTHTHGVKMHDFGVYEISNFALWRNLLKYLDIFMPTPFGKVTHFAVWAALLQAVHQTLTKIKIKTDEKAQKMDNWLSLVGIATNSIISSSSAQHWGEIRISKCTLLASYGSTLTEMTRQTSTLPHTHPHDFGGGNHASYHGNWTARSS